MVGVRWTVSMVAAGTVVLVLLVMAARLHGGAVHRLDVHIDDHVNDFMHRHRGQARAWRLVSAIGGPATWRVAAGGVALLLWFSRRTVEAIFVAVAIVGAAAWSELVKVLVRRPRPVVPFPVEHVAGWSFPSGHALTSATAALVTVVLAAPHLRRGMRVLVATVAALIALSVGASRVLLGVHYVSDVAGGWVIAALWVAAVWAGAEWLGGRRLGGAGRSG
jgi:membrane-associated phospholipid phosphatase